MLDAPSRFGIDLPDVEGRLHEIVGRHGGLAPLRRNPVKPTLARHDDALGQVAKHRVGRLAIATPRDRTRCPFGFLPDDLSTQQQSEIVLQNRDHIGAQRAVRLAAEVGDVHCDSAAWLKDLDTRGKHVVQHLEIVEVGLRNTGTPLRVSGSPDRELVLLAHEVGRRGHDERHGIRREDLHLETVAVVDRRKILGHGGDRVVGADLGWRKRVEIGRAGFHDDPPRRRWWRWSFGVRSQGLRGCVAILGRARVRPVQLPALCPRGVTSSRERHMQVPGRAGDPPSEETGCHTVSTR